MKNRNSILKFRLSQTPLKLHVDIWCIWSFRDPVQSSSPIDVDYDIGCCQGFAFHESDNDTEMHYALEVSINAVTVKILHVNMNVLSLRRFNFR